MTEIKGLDTYDLEENAVIESVNDFDEYIDPQDMTLRQCLECWLEDNWKAINERDGYHFELDDLFLEPYHDDRDAGLNIYGHITYESSRVLFDEDMDGVGIFESELKGMFLWEAVERIIDIIQGEFERMRRDAIDRD